VQVVVDAPGGVLAVQRLAGSTSLVVFAADSGDLGALLYELRRHGPALAPLV
jgi:hypothetical protein